MVDVLERLPAAKRLAVAIELTGTTGTEIAERAGLNRSVLSGIQTGRVVAREAERTAISSALDLPVEVLFPRTAEVA
jgi:transcriptional regulator with XRE-family HTH domain